MVNWNLILHTVSFSRIRSDKGDERESKDPSINLNVGLPAPRHPNKIQDTQLYCCFMDALLTVYTVMNYDLNVSWMIHDSHQSCCFIDVWLTLNTAMGYTLNVSLHIPRYPWKIHDSHQSCFFMVVWLTVYTVMYYTLIVGLPLPWHTC